MTTGLIIGRFQPFHFGHLKLIETAEKNLDKLIIGIGSSQFSHTKENPFTAEERKRMLEESLNADESQKFQIIPIPDVNNDKIWVSHVRKLVPEFQVVYTNGALERKLFSDAGIEVKSTQIFNRDNYSGTEIRRRILEGEDWKELVPKGTLKVIEEINGEERIRKLG